MLSETMQKKVKGFRDKLSSALLTGKGKLARELTCEDIHLLKAFCDNVTSEKYISAFTFAHDCDTIVRDNIPADIYDYVMNRS